MSKKIDFEIFTKLFKQSDLSKVELGKILNVKPTALQGWFERRSVPTKYLYPLSGEFKTNPRYLLGETKDETRMQIIPILGESTFVTTSMHEVIEDSEKEFPIVERHYFGEGVYGVVQADNDMKGTIQEGALCLCNPNTIIEEDNLVHFTYGDTNGIRRYRLSADKTTIVLVADNTDIAPIFIAWNSEIELKMVKIFRIEQDV